MKSLWKHVSFLHSLAVFLTLVIAHTPLASPVDPADVAVPDLRGHQPQIVTQTQQDAMTFWAFTRNGVAQRRFNLDDGWSGWQLFGFPADITLPPDKDKLGSQIALTTGLDGRGVIQFGVFGYPTPPNNNRAEVALLYSSALGSLDTNFDWKTEPVPAGLIPASVVTQNEFRAQAIVSDHDSYGFTAYGTSEEDQTPNAGAQVLLEYKARYTGNWATPADITTSFTNHDRPKIDGSFRNVVLGPGGAVSVPIQSRTKSELQQFVFVKAIVDQHNRVAWLRRQESGNATWEEDLGFPPRTNGQLIDAPVALIRSVPDGLSIFVFVVAYDLELERYQLYSREWTLVEGTQGSWGGWRDHGWPVNLGGMRQPLFAGNTPFRLTTYAMWEHKGKPKINLFGYGNSEGPGKPTRLIEFLHDGYDWHWSGSHAAPQSDLGMTTQSMAIIEIPNRKYFSVICRGSDGSIWEHYYTIDGNKWRGWFWRGLSK